MHRLKIQTTQLIRMHGKAIYSHEVFSVIIIQQNSRFKLLNGVKDKE
jgi:hypothetical protein